jgi:N-acetylneuraminic acid mutarotase
MSTSGAPQARSDATGIWTGSRMVVWAGDPGTGAADPPSGGRYDPIGNVWSLVTSVGAPASRTGHTSVWTGSLMLTWGGALAGGQVADDGGRYDPIHDTWTPLAPSGAPSARYGHSAVWTGNEMIVWGGSGGGNLASGARFDPVMASWTSTSLIGAPAARSFHAAFWTGSTMLIWGGQTSPGGRQLGARYDPQTDTWAAISEAGAPVKLLASAVWSGQQLIVWGGFDGSTQIQTGGRYDPAADVWTPTSTTNAPEGRTNHAAAWTGSRMLIWGGHKVSPPSPPVYFSTGGLYDPSSDSWTATATVGAPAGEDPNFGVWVDDTFVVGDYSHTGGRYRPAQDAWAPISTVGMPAPSSRSVVVTGPLMVVWGNSDWHLGDQGARYDPVGDVWSATSTNGAPIGRYWHSAVWTGSSMLVWGGNNNWGSFRSGGEYIADPDLDGDGFNACLGDCAARNGAVYPGAPQVCDGVNNDCTAPGWPSLAGSNESDNDGDGSSACAGDCNDSDPGTHAAPIEVANVRLGKSAGSVVVSWDSEASLAGASTTYDVVDGSLAALRSTATYSGAACLASGVSVTSLNDAPPAPASASYYLVRASNACGLATFGDSSFVPDPRDALDAGSTCP